MASFSVCLASVSPATVSKFTRAKVLSVINVAWIACKRLALALSTSTIYDDTAVFITLPTGAVVEYCDEQVCVRVCVSVCLCVCPWAYLQRNNCKSWSLPNFLCMLPMAVAQYSSGRVTKSQEEGAVLGVFLPTDNAVNAHVCCKRDR